MGPGHRKPAIGRDPALQTPAMSGFRVVSIEAHQLRLPILSLGHIELLRQCPGSEKDLVPGQPRSVLV